MLLQLARAGRTAVPRPVASSPLSSPAHAPTTSFLPSPYLRAPNSISAALIHTPRVLVPPASNSPRVLLPAPATTGLRQLSSESGAPSPPRKGILGSLLHGDDDEGDHLDEKYFSDSQSKQAARGKYVHELMIHDVKPEAWEDYVALIADYYPKISQDPKYKMKLFGSWQTEIGNVDQVVHIWQYDNYPGYDGSMELRVRDAARNEFMRKLRPMIVSRKNQIMLEFDFWYTSEPAKLGGIYELRTYNLKPGRLLEWKSEWEKGLKARKKFVRPVGAWFGQIGDLHVVHHTDREDCDLVLNPSDVSPKCALYFKSVKNSTVTVNAPCTKVFIEDCEHVTFRIAARVVTQMCEIWRSTDAVLHIGTRVRTVQVDGCTRLSISYATRELFDTIVWGGATQELAVGFADDKDDGNDDGAGAEAAADDGSREPDASSNATPVVDATAASTAATDGPPVMATRMFRTGLRESQSALPTMNISESDQFIIRLIDGKIKSELLVRVGGFATTVREDDEHVERLAKNAKKLIRLYRTSGISGPAEVSSAQQKQ
ncbi:hypothetical protein HDU84_000852 [Entophlyctis sp. JEL0112]|nr:hypothetical protein HDU84_000852 [Entophlyctis sp. JEL0112]